MKKVFTYKGYHAKIKFDYDSLSLYGKIENIDDLVTFEGTDPKKIEKEFHHAVDDYLEFCREIGKDPAKEYRGTFNVRINPELHKQLAHLSIVNGDTLNSSVEKAIYNYVHKEKDRNEYNIQIFTKYIHNYSIYTPYPIQQSIPNYSIHHKYSKEIN